MVTVTSIISGDRAGWNGEGYVSIKVGGIVDLKRLAVTFDATVVNSCYELSAGTVTSAYDPSWSNILDVDETVCNIKNIINDVNTLFLELTDELKTISCEPEQIAKFRNRVDNVDKLRVRVGNSCDISDSEKTSLITRLDNLKTSCVCVINTACPDAIPNDDGLSSIIARNVRTTSTEESCSLQDVISQSEELKNEISASSGNSSLSENEDYNAASISFCHSNGTASPVDFGDNTFNGYEPTTRVYTINGIGYRGFSKKPRFEFIGFYKADEVVQLPVLTYDNLIKLRKLRGVIVGTPKPNASCPSFDVFDPDSQGDWLEASGRKKLQEKIAGMGDYGKNVEITVKNCSAPDTDTHNISADAIKKTPSATKDIQIEMYWDGSKWVRIIKKYQVSKSSTAHLQLVTGM